MRDLGEEFSHFWALRLKAFAHFAKRRSLKLTYAFLG
jgi:hypothetical protein